MTHDKLREPLLADLANDSAVSIVFYSQAPADGVDVDLGGGSTVSLAASAGEQAGGAAARRSGIVTPGRSMR